jgi:hypothetical protein
MGVPPLEVRYPPLHFILRLLSCCPLHTVTYSIQVVPSRVLPVTRASTSERGTV